MSATYCAKRPYLLEMVGGAPIGTAADKPYRRPLGPLMGARLNVSWIKGVADARINP